jgi:hypothetical protein
MVADCLATISQPPKGLKISQITVELCDPECNLNSDTPFCDYETKECVGLPAQGDYMLESEAGRFIIGRQDTLKKLAAALHLSSSAITPYPGKPVGETLTIEEKPKKKPASSPKKMTKVSEPKEPSAPKKTTKVSEPKEPSAPKGVQVSKEELIAAFEECLKQTVKKI